MSRALPGQHGLWIDKNGNVFDRDDPRNDGKRLRDMDKPLPIWTGTPAVHPQFRVPRGMRYTMYEPPNGKPDVGAVMIVWYEFESTGNFLLFGSPPTWAMIRVDRSGNGEGRFLFSAWGGSKLEGVNTPPPNEVLVRGEDLANLEGLISFQAPFSGLATSFRAAWARAWNTPLQKPARAQLPENADAGDVVEAVLRNTAGLGRRAIDTVTAPLQKPARTLFVIAAVAIGVGLFLRFRGGS